MTQYLNQFVQTPEKGQLDLAFNANSISAQVKADESAALVAGQAVKIVATSKDAAPVVTAATAATDAVLGFVNFSLKDKEFKAGKKVEISLKGNVMFMEAAGAISAGAAVGIVVSGQKVRVPEEGDTVVGWALDAATAAGQLIRVYIETPKI